MDGAPPQLNPAKFKDANVTADGSIRASVPLYGIETLWFNTGTLCNITCANCYIESSPENDALVYIQPDDVGRYLDEARSLNHPMREMGLTGGEPFMNPQIIEIIRQGVTRGLDVLVLTNAMRPITRPRVQQGLQALIAEFGDQLNFRISLDHYDATVHDAERGRGAFDKSLQGMRWLSDQEANMAIAARQLRHEEEADVRAAFTQLCQNEGFDIDCNNPAKLVIFPEMDAQVDVPEITTECWGILNKSPRDVMCATTRMVVHRRGADRPTVLACTLLAYDTAFELGETLALATGPVSLNHPHCAKFCVLGGASCSA